MSQEEIKKAEERLRMAMLTSDVEELDALLSPSLSFTTFLGTKIGKEEDLEAHRSGFLKMHAIDLSETEIQFVGDLAIVTCLASIDASFDDDRSHQEFRFTRVWSKASGNYQVAAGQATLVYASLEQSG